MDELSPAIEMALDYAEQLRAIQPDHELLKYLDTGKDPALNDEFEKRFWNKPFSPKDQPGHLVNATIWACYLVALKKEVERLHNLNTQPFTTSHIGEKGIVQIGETLDSEDGGILRI